MEYQNRPIDMISFYDFCFNRRRRNRDRCLKELGKSIPSGAYVDFRQYNGFPRIYETDRLDDSEDEDNYDSDDLKPHN